MRKILVLALVFAISGLASNSVLAQYARRDVRPPVTETSELDPSTPLGKVQEIAERLDAIELATSEIAERLDDESYPGYKSSLDKILESANATRSEVARLGAIANDVGYIAQAVETIERNTEATSETARNVANIAVVLKQVATAEQLNAVVKDAVAVKTNETLSILEEQKKSFLQALEDAQSVAKDDAENLKRKLETASNIIILLGVLIAVSLVISVYKWLREQSREQIQTFIANANNKKSSTK
ncbi:MAG: hypothetical protein J6K25_05050 [Thermoguttaceae bacterium]|nr:hypothetical protein [Thermoguttaceae bacterium]